MVSPLITAAAFGIRMKLCQTARMGNGRQLCPSLYSAGPPRRAETGIQDGCAAPWCWAWPLRFQPVRTIHRTTDRMADTAAIITATTVRAPFTAATTPPVPTGARKPVTARRSSAAMRKYAGIISNHTSGLSGSAFMRLISIATHSEGSRAPMTIEAGLRGRDISIGSNISDIDRQPTAHRIRAGHSALTSTCFRLAKQKPA
ncbi:hypothetical protein C7440_2093 [Pusillimonas noertemannii]|uniref:Uncharacterized protein n=1 Tax=Pusillimonas noertemannii TaxID=305977 RepID=A0A2U1CNL4_9BURK|nr:hypothetical protein C7440_2093 [Pusillimonas noertemannii]